MRIDIDKRAVEEYLEESFELAEETKDRIQALLDYLNDVERKVVEILEKHNFVSDEWLRKFDYKGFGLRMWVGNGMGEIFISKGTRIIPGSAKRIGAGFYLHGDLSCYLRYMDIDDIVELARILPEWLKHFRSRLELAKELKDLEN